MGILIDNKGYLEMLEIIKLLPEVWDLIQSQTVTKEHLPFKLENN